MNEKRKKTYAIEKYWKEEKRWVTLETWKDLQFSRAMGAWMVLKDFYGDEKMQLRLMRSDGHMMDTMGTRVKPSVVPNESNRTV